jgi:hypothetical protein
MIQMMGYLDNSWVGIWKKWMMKKQRLGVVHKAATGPGNGRPRGRDVPEYGDRNA